MGADELHIEMAGTESQKSFPLDTWECVKGSLQKDFFQVYDLPFCPGLLYTWLRQ